MFDRYSIRGARAKLFLGWDYDALCQGVLPLGTDGRGWRS